MSKKGLPKTLTMRHDSHYVEELIHSGRSIGRMILIGLIEPNPEQPRTQIGDLTELKSSINEKGILEPLLVKPLIRNSKWLLIAGERRWRAASELGLKEVPCIELDIDESEVAEIALIENLQRKDLSLWEEADGLYSLTKRFAYTHEQVAKKIGKSRSTVTEMFSIARIPPNVRFICAEKNVFGKSQLLEVARQFDETEMLKYLETLSAEMSKSELSSKKVSSPSDNFDKSKKTESQNNFPLRKFAYQQADFKVEIKFKKPADSEQLKRTLLSILASLDT